ncbi:MAG: hypothetical protein DLM64_15640 [Solirubrobacterales bacterium]|nr:MAG: hypothetical protein DLM64_15640 [Solirubrobacterales bacterium]
MIAAGAGRSSGQRAQAGTRWYSALDAYVRHFEVVIPSDAVAHIHPDLAQGAIRMMETNMGAKIVTAEASARPRALVHIDARVSDMQCV